MGSCFLCNFVSHALCYLSTVFLTVLAHIIEIRLEGRKNDYVLVLRMLPSRIGGERLSRTSLTKTRCVVTCRTHAR